VREVKFRLWCEKNKEWEKGEWMIAPNGRVIEMLFHRNVLLREDTHLLMQYTGLKDKNGKEIYEGDIVQRISMTPGGIDFLGKVVYGECEYWLENERGAVNLFTEIDELEVISNVYENPELLGGNKNA
jgi:uncharacterized phage protein (TIGR01671 family)